MFAALDVATGNVIGKLKRRHQTVEFIRFLRHIDQQVPDDLELHRILDHSVTHKTKKVKDWLRRHPRFHGHFTPTYRPWIHRVERFFAALTEQQLRRGTHRCVPALESVLMCPTPPF